MNHPLLVNPRTQEKFTLIDANRLRRTAIDMQARHHHEGILAEQMLAQSAFIMETIKKSTPDGVDPTLNQPGA